jgi:hypothetical protein
MGYNSFAMEQVAMYCADGAFLILSVICIRFSYLKWIEEQKTESDDEWIYRQW